MEKNISGEVEDLHNSVETAEINALEALNNPTTRFQFKYIKNPSPRAWGCCVEEQLNMMAVSKDWKTQFKVKHSRPDYYKYINGKHLFVDLTTEKQSGPGGPHITEKLDCCGYNLEENVQAADITHRSLNPELPQNIIEPINEILTEQQMLCWRLYNKYLNSFDNEEYFPDG